MSQWTQLAREGLWTNNPALVQLLGNYNNGGGYHLFFF